MISNTVDASFFDDEDEDGEEEEEDDDNDDDMMKVMTNDSGYRDSSVREEEGVFAWNPSTGEEEMGDSLGLAA